MIIGIEDYRTVYEKWHYDNRFLFVKGYGNYSIDKIIEYKKGQDGFIVYLSSGYFRLKCDSSEMDDAGKLLEHIFFMLKEERLEAKKYADQLREKQEEYTKEIMSYNDLYEYDVVAIVDEKSGILDPKKLRYELATHGKNGWRLVNSFTNEAGVNSSMMGLGGISSGTNATIDVTYLIFERCVKRYDHTQALLLQELKNQNEQQRQIRQQEEKNHREQQEESKREEKKTEINEQKRSESSYDAEKEKQLLENYEKMISENGYQDW